MSATLNPYLMFDGNAREAMEFYESVLGGTLVVSTFADTGAEGVPDPSKVMHAQLDTPSGFTLMASDLAPGMELPKGNAVHVCLSGDSGDELRGYWTGLSAGGTVETPLEKQMWGDEFGACTDRFGISWMVNISDVQESVG